MSFHRQLAALRGRDYVAPTPAPLPEGIAPLGGAVSARLIDRPETAICDALGMWLRERDWEVFFEVPLDRFRPDVVAFRGDETLAIEAKRLDVPGVIKQGLRLVSRIDYPYVALPTRTARRVDLEFARREHARTLSGKKVPAFPGVLTVGEDGTVGLLREVNSAPTRRIAAERLRQLAERFGEERGGMPSVDQTPRNIELYRGYAAGDSIAALARAHNLSDTATRTSIKRINAWRKHLSSCASWPCPGGTDEDRSFYGGAHHHHALLAGLPDLSARG